MKTKVIHHVESEWMRDRKSVRVRDLLLSIDMKTKFVQHVPRIIKFSSFQVFKFSKLSITLKHSDIPGSQLLSDVQTFLAWNQSKSRDSSDSFVTRWTTFVFMCKLKSNCLFTWFQWFTSRDSCDWRDFSDSLHVIPVIHVIHLIHMLHVSDPWDRLNNFCYHM